MTVDIVGSRHALLFHEDIRPGWAAFECFYYSIGYLDRRCDLCIGARDKKSAVAVSMASA